MQAAVDLHRHGRGQRVHREEVDPIRDGVLDDHPLGVPPDQASWGQILADASGLYDVAWWLMVFPGAFLVLTTLAFNLLGDGLRDALDPKIDQK